MHVLVEDELELIACVAMLLVTSDPGETREGVCDRCVHSRCEEATSRSNGCVDAIDEKRSSDCQVDVKWTESGIPRSSAKGGVSISISIRMVHSIDLNETNTMMCVSVRMDVSFVW